MQLAKRLVPLALVPLAVIMTVAASFADGRPPHERKEVAGLAIIFGAEPEPAITEEMQSLRWRVSSLEDEEPYADFQDAEVTISREGVELGAFKLRGSRRDPGQYQTRHIFTEAGEYDTVLKFRKGDDEEVHTVDFAFRIADRSSLEIPARRGGGN